MTQRLQIRDALHAVLADLLGSENVVVGRYKPLPVEHCPFVRVLTESETAEPYNDVGQERRTLSVQIEIFVDDEDDPEADINGLSEKIEVRLAKDDCHYLNGLLTEPLAYQGYELTADDVPEREVAAAVLSYEAVYLFEPKVDDTAVPLERVYGDIDLPGGSKPEMQFHVDDLYKEKKNG